MHERSPGQSLLLRQPITRHRSYGFPLKPLLQRHSGRLAIVKHSAFGPHGSSTMHGFKQWPLIQALPDSHSEFLLHPTTDTADNLLKTISLHDQFSIFTYLFCKQSLDFHHNLPSKNIQGGDFEQNIGHLNRNYKDYGIVDLDMPRLPGNRRLLYIPAARTQWLDTKQFFF